jgi:hypothetical protein
MPEPGPRSSRRWLAAAAAVIVLVAAIVLLVRPHRPQPAPPAAPSAPAPAAAPAVELPQPIPPLDRGALIEAARAAADAYASGKPLPRTDAPSIVGRKFELRLAFGCWGPATQDVGEVGRWLYDPKRKTIRITAHRENWSDVAWIAELAASEDIEAVEGFWIPRPWTRDEGCPPVAPAVAADPAAQASAVSDAQTLGLAAFFARDGSRVVRRDSKPYEFVQKAEADPGTAPRRYDLLIAGRVAGYGDGQAVRCHAGSPRQRPVCLIAVDFESVALLDPRTGETLATWGG